MLYPAVTRYSLFCDKGGGHTIPTSLELMWCYACSWDVRGDLTLNSTVQIHTSVTLLTSRDLAWSSGQLTCQHASQISAVAHISWDVTYRVERSSDVTSCFQKWRKSLLKKYANGPFYMTPSHQIIEISMRAIAWEGIGKELKIRRFMWAHVTWG